MGLVSLVYHGGGFGAFSGKMSTAAGWVLGLGLSIAHGGFGWVKD